MKRKVINTIIDIALMVGVFAVVDLLALNVFHKESVWLDIGLYIAVYIIVFGVKSGIIALWKRKKTDLPADKDELK